MWFDKWAPNRDGGGTRSRSGWLGKHCTSAAEAEADCATPLSSHEEPTLSQTWQTESPPEATNEATQECLHVAEQYHWGLVSQTKATIEISKILLATLSEEEGNVNNALASFPNACWS